jgi:hypothetical protein
MKSPTVKFSCFCHTYKQLTKSLKNRQKTFTTEFLLLESRELSTVSRERTRKKSKEKGRTYGGNWGKLYR